MIDLNAWERQQRAANRFAADMAMYRLGRKFDWPIPHPSVQLVVKAHNDITAQYRRAFRALAAWFVPRYDALCKIFDGAPMTCSTCPRIACSECGKCLPGWVDLGFASGAPIVGGDCSYCGCPRCDCPASLQRDVGAGSARVAQSVGREAGNLEVAGSSPAPGAHGLGDRKAAPARPALPFTEQLANIAPYIARAARQVCPADVDAEDVARLAVERFSGIGALEHGDAMFHLGPLELLGEEVAEYADAVIYRARRMALARLTRADIARAFDVDEAMLQPLPAITDDQADAIRMAWPQKYGGADGERRIAAEVAAQIDRQILHGRRDDGYDVDESAEAPDLPQGDA